MGAESSVLDGRLLFLLSIYLSDKMFESTEYLAGAVWIAIMENH